MSFSAVPVQDRVKKILLGAVKNSRIPNAYLFFGPEAGGELEAALELAKTLNCEKESLDSCGSCGSCKKIEEGLHPDVLLIEPTGASIGIERTRELRSLARYGPSHGRYKVVIINGADAFTDEAANSFLKLLEEPPEKVLFILISSKQDAFPLTISSRCQKIIFSEAEDSAQSGADDEETRIVLEEIDNLKGKSIVELLRFSSQLSGSKEVVEEVFDAALLKYGRLLRKNGSAKEMIKIILGTRKCLKKRANLKLALDMMCLKFKEALNDSKACDKA